MKKILITFILFVSLTTIGFSQFNFGAGAQMIFDNSIFGVQGKALYEVDEMWRGSGTFTIHLTDGADWTIDLDAQYKLLEVSSNFNLAPFAGLSVFNGLDTNIGINLGAFIDFVPSDSYHIYIEPKIVLDAADAFVLSAGILF